MTRKTTTSEFRARAVSMVVDGKSQKDVAAELGVEVQKVKRWYNNAMNALMNSATELFDDRAQAESAAVDEPVSSSAADIELNWDAEIRRLRKENERLKKIMNLSSQWISIYIDMQSENQTRR